MADLSKLASTYNLEGNLYYGGGLQKILRLIGEYRKRMFLRSTAKSNLTDQQRWDELFIFLENERSEREIFIINDKAEKSMCLDFKGKTDKVPKNEKRDFNSKNEDSREKKGFLSQNKNDAKFDKMCRH